MLKEGGAEAPISWTARVVVHGGAPEKWGGAAGAERRWGRERVAGEGWGVTVRVYRAGRYVGNKKAMFSG
ncbi:MAG: hypothetical protein RLZZ458_1000 [Planctomycetota bacterium]